MHDRIGAGDDEAFYPPPKANTFFVLHIPKKKKQRDIPKATIVVGITAPESASPSNVATVTLHQNKMKEEEGEKEREPKLCGKEVEGGVKGNEREDEGA
ncbi:sh3 domain-containing protein [Sesbania bispinosa]|nr:sh3 domain-containing protein [Sesbania bispinosa]